MEEIKIDSQRIQNGIDYLKLMIDNREGKYRGSQDVTVYMGALLFSIECMEKLLEVYQLSTKELDSIDNLEDDLLAAYEELKLLRK